MEEYAHGITVVGDWSSINPKTVQTKLQLYFQSKKKSQGGDCEVKCGDRKATVLFKCQLTRDNVLSKKEHNITINNQVLKLNVFELSSAAEDHTEQLGKSPFLSDLLFQEISNNYKVDGAVVLLQGLETEPSSPPCATETGSDVAHGSQQMAVQSTTNEAASKVSLGDPPKPSAVVLENLPDYFIREYLLLFVENLTDVSEENIILEFIPESNTAVITFSDPNAAEMFIKKSRTKKKFQQKGITGRVLEQSRSIKVENLPSQCNNEWLELYFEKWGGDVEKITIISEEQAAIVTFKEQEAAKKIVAKKHTFYNTPVDVYIYYQSLGTALYGKDRPTWALPTPFTEKLHPAIREFLCRKGFISSSCNQMMLQHCQVNMDKDEVLLSPLPSLLKRKGITNKHIDDWEENTKAAFKNILSNFALIEYSVTPSLWLEVEKDIWSTVQDKAFLDMNTLTGNLALAGTAKDINILKPILKDFLKKASSQLERKINCISDSMNMFPATFFLLQLEGLTHAASKYPQLELDYKKDTNQLIFKGLKFEIIDIKNWIFEKQHEMKHKTIKMDPSLLEFLRSMDWEEMSRDLFTSKKIGAVYKFENWDMVLTGNTDKALTEAEKRLEMMLTFQDISLDDPEVVKKPEWQVLMNQMCNIYNSSRKKTVHIKSSNHKNKIIVCGFKDYVLEVSKNLKTFINTHSRINEAIRVKSHAVVKFINEKKSQEWQKFVKSGEVKIDFETKKPLIRVYGERVHVQPALKFLQNLAETLHSDKMTVKKAGVKKFFQEQGTMVLLMMKERGFLVLLEEDYVEDDDELDYNRGKLNTFTSFFGSGGTEPGVKKEEFMMVSKDFEPVVFQLCGESIEDLSEARKLINGIILREHMSLSVQDSAINFLSQEEADVMHKLQRELTVSIRLSKKGPKPEITLEGLTRDVVKAENRVRDMIRKAEKQVTRKRDATLLSNLVEWQYEDKSKNFIPFDILTNFDLEEACKTRKSVDIFINNEPFNAILDQKVAIGRSRQIKIKTTTLADQTLPQNWTDMKGRLVLQVPIQQGTPDYTFVENEFRKTGLTSNILNIERIQNETLWRNYMNQKALLERKNKHQKNEKLLFHGTGSENIDKINGRGFNRSFAGMHGAMIGNGVYFAVDPCYSAQGYAKPDRLGHKRMYLAQVLVGDYTTGKRGLLAPPVKSSSTSDLYDSVTDNHRNPSMFVIFHDVQAYPKYLITFQ